MSARKFNRQAEKPIREIIWRTPQEIDALRLQHEIDEMVKHTRPAYAITRSARRAVYPTGRHSVL